MHGHNDIVLTGVLVPRLFMLRLNGLVWVISKGQRWHLLVLILGILGRHFLVLLLKRHIGHDVLTLDFHLCIFINSVETVVLDSSRLKGVVVEDTESVG